jgi:hypothetical protein
MDVYHGKLMRNRDEPGLFCRRSLAWCAGCNLALETVEYFRQTRTLIRETRDPNEIQVLKEELGLVAPLAGELGSGSGV